ncbi:MAG: phosphomannose isomerase type II C-terminal cupin domain [Nanoarchaeota archaeon]
MENKFIHDIRPWGSFVQFTSNEVSTVKIISVDANGILSRQRHRQREELWVMLDDGMMVEIDGNVIFPKNGEHVFISKGSVHRLSSETGGRVLEISFGHFDENDIERLEDAYSRK